MATPGPGVDAQGQPVVDPTQNVLDLVEAAIQRQDDLREQEALHIREIMALRAESYEKLRVAETQRIDAIRAVDVGAVNRAAEVQQAAATALAVQLAATAEASRTQVAAAAAAQVQSLAAALEPIQKDIRDLRDAQSQVQGGKAQSVESRDDRRPGNSWTLALIGVAAVLGGLFLTFLGTAIALAVYLATKSP